MQVIFEQIVQYPHELKYQRLNVKNLSNILDNCALSLDLLVKLGFKYTPNKSKLTFVGMARYIAHTRRLPLILVQLAMHAHIKKTQEKSTAQQTIQNQSDNTNMNSNDQPQLQAQIQATTTTTWQ